MKVIGGLFAGLESLILIGQITTLVSTYWTSWDLKFNWTYTGEFARRPQTDGELVSQGHAGLWSRCIKVYNTGRDQNHSHISTDNCLYNFDDINSSVNYTFGKACKVATAALCIAEAAVTFVLLVITVVIICWSRGQRFLKNVPLPLLLLQGLVSFIIPLMYISGNMAELIDQLSAAYGLLLIVHMDAWYTHDWAFWIQVTLAVLWIVTIGNYVLFYTALRRLLLQTSATTNGKKEFVDTAEMQPLRTAHLAG